MTLGSDLMRMAMTHDEIRQLKAEIERLRAENKAFQEANRKFAQRELRAAEAERDAFRDTATARDRNEDALLADAERYRWLRDHAPEKWAPWADERDDGNCTSDEIDAAIDAAMKEGGNGRR